MTVLTLYGKAGCCLCDDARRTIQDVVRGREVDVREVDVSLDPTLERAYGERVPVVEIDGEEAFEYRVDAAELDRRLGRVAS